MSVSVSIYGKNPRRFLFTAYSKMAATHQNWREINENEVIRGKCCFRTVLHIFRGEENKFWRMAIIL